MKRSAALKQLSREHHTALVLAKRAQRLSRESAEAAKVFMHQLVETFAIELEPHFRVEEAILLPALQNVNESRAVQRTLAEHAELRALSERIGKQDYTALHRFGEALEAHVRFEERELFPLAEAGLSPDVLAAVGSHFS